ASAAAAGVAAARKIAHAGAAVRERGALRAGRPDSALENARGCAPGLEAAGDGARPPAGRARGAAYDRRPARAPQVAGPDRLVRHPGDAIDVRPVPGGGGAVAVGAGNGAD